MGIYFDVDDIFGMAERIERDAAAFYRRAGAAAGDPESRRVLLYLADMEADHEHVFAGIRAHLSASGSATGRGAGGGPAEDWPGLANVLASGIKEDLAERFTGSESREQILRKAIDFEKDSIVFIVSVRNLLSDREDRERIDRLITEELGHILSLTGRLASRS